MVGAYGVGGFHGAAYLYDSAGNFLRSLNDPDLWQRDGVGHSVAVGSNILVGAFGVNNFAGAASLYDASGNFLRTFGDPVGNRSDQFGYAVAGTGNYALVGSNGVGNGNLGAGKVYMYDTTTGNLVHTFENPNGFPSVFFGGAVAAAGSNVLVGAIAAGNPAAYLFNTSVPLLLPTLPQAVTRISALPWPWLPNAATDSPN